MRTQSSTEGIEPVPQLGNDATPIAASSPVRLMLYGREKTRKTMWALSAAALDLNVLLIDGDDGAHIASQFPSKLMQRVAHIRCVDTPEEFIFAKLVTHMVTGKPFAFQEATGRLTSKVGASGEWFQCDGLDKLSRNDVLVIDSWTALTASMKLQYSQTNGIDLADAAKTEWPGYGWMQNLTDHILNCLHHLPCHIIVIAHEQQYEKYKGTGKERVLDWQRTQPLGASGNTSGRLGKHFSDIFRFVGKSTKSTSIEAFGKSDQVGGSRYFPPEKFTYEGPGAPSGAENWDFSQYAKVAGIKGNGAPSTTYRFVDAGAEGKKL